MGDFDSEIAGPLTVGSLALRVDSPTPAGGGDTEYTVLLAYTAGDFVDLCVLNLFCLASDFPLTDRFTSGTW